MDLWLIVFNPLQFPFHLTSWDRQFKCMWSSTIFWFGWEQLHRSRNIHGRVERWNIVRVKGRFGSRENGMFVWCGQEKDTVLLPELPFPPYLQHYSYSIYDGNSWHISVLAWESWGICCIWIESYKTAGRLTCDFHLLHCLIGVVGDMNIDTDGLPVVINLRQNTHRKAEVFINNIWTFQFGKENCCGSKVYDITSPPRRSHTPLKPLDNLFLAIYTQGCRLKGRNTFFCWSYDRCSHSSGKTCFMFKTLGNVLEYKSACVFIWTRLLNFKYWWFHVIRVWTECCFTKCECEWVCSALCVSEQSALSGFPLFLFYLIFVHFVQRVDVKRFEWLASGHLTFGYM